MADNLGSSDFLNDVAVLTGGVAAIPLLFLFFVAAMLDLKAICILSGAAALCAIFCVPIRRTPVRIAAIVAAWTGLIASLWMFFSFEA